MSADMHRIPNQSVKDEVSFNQTIFSQGVRTVTPNYFNEFKPNLTTANISYKLPGNINGTNGIFEIGVRPSVSGNTEVIIHRFFQKIKP
jgi:hypothetical protein